MEDDTATVVPAGPSAEMLSCIRAVVEEVLARRDDHGAGSSAIGATGGSRAPSGRPRSDNSSGNLAGGERSVSEVYSCVGHDPLRVTL